MKRPFRLACTIALLAAFSSSPLFAADAPKNQLSQYVLGDQTLAINAGLFIPLVLMPTGTWLLAGNPPQLSLGGIGSLSWAMYVAPQVRVGAELGGTFSFDPNSNLLLMLPIIAKGAYIFTIYPFEIPLTFGAGMNILKYTDKYYVDLLLRPGASLYWIFNSSWSFGLNLNYWLDFQFSSDFRVGNFLEVSLTALYHY